MYATVWTSDYSHINVHTYGQLLPRQSRLMAISLGPRLSPQGGESLGTRLGGHQPPIT